MGSWSAPERARRPKCCSEVGEGAAVALAAEELLVAGAGVCPLVYAVRELLLPSKISPSSSYTRRLKYSF